MSLAIARSETALRDDALERCIADLKRIGDELSLNDFDSAAAHAYEAMAEAIRSRRPSVIQGLDESRLSKIKGELYGV